ncbi:MAG: HNH endonuclease [Prosthecobacter sp.]
MNEIIQAYLKLQTAIARNRTIPYCLRLWGKFIRVRDGGRCVLCQEEGRLFAHHIARKCLFTPGKLETGNGITLCRECHGEYHAGFNGTPDLKAPMDLQGGEKIDFMMEAYELLLRDAKERETLCDDFYFIGDQMLNSFKKLQGFESNIVFPGCRLEQAFLIWRQTPRHTLHALLQANGFELSQDFVQTGPTYSFYITDTNVVGKDAVHF